MKKKILIAAVIIAIIGVVTGLLIFINLPQTNPSRRDGEMAQGVALSDGNLLSGDGVVGPSGDGAGAQATQIEAQKNEIDVSGITADTNEPVSEEVEPVSTVILNEAIKIEDGDKGAFYGNGDFQNVIPSDISSFSKENIPSKYDSRDVEGKSYVTKLEDQGYTYLCWSFATIASIESDLLKHHDDIDVSKLDLSEKHLAYYNMHKCEGSLNGYIDGDYRELVNADNEDGAWIFDYDTNYVAMGGVTNFCMSLLTAWKGPVFEAGDDAFSSIYGESFLFKDNANPPSAAYNAEYHVQSIGEILGNKGNRDLIKQMIMEHGAVTASVNSDNIYWKNHNKTLYSSFGGAEVPTANHEVVIVGWDDDYDGSNFVTMPKENGAWICRNSWGEASGEKGYFYLSYCDETTADNTVTFYSVAAKDDKNWYDNNYQVSGFIDNVVSSLDDSQNYATAYSESVNPYGVLYSAASDESLKAVGLMSLETYRQYQIEVFVNPAQNDQGEILFNDLQKPVCTTLVSNISGGYHTYELSEPVNLNKDDDFFVMVKPVTPGKLIYERSDTNTGTANYDEWNNLTGNVHNNYEASGRSFYIANDGKSMKPQTDKDFFLKAYTNSK